MSASSPSTRRRAGTLISGVSALAMVAILASMVRSYQREQAPSEDFGQTCCLPGAEPRRAPNAQIPAELGGGAPERGEIVYVAACANCHDDDGSGRRGRASYPGLMHLGISTLEPHEVAKVMLHGRGRMPAFGGLLHEDEVRDLIAYLVLLRAKPRSPKAGP